MTAGLAPLTTARFVRPLVLHQPSRFASASPVLRQTSHFASDLPICISVRATHAPCPRRRSDAFDALQLEFTVYLLTTWRQHKQMALMDFPKALVQNCRLSQAPARCRCHSLPAGWRGREVLARAALRTPSLRGHASRPFPSGSIPLWRCRQCVPTALILRRFQSRTRERIEHMVPRIEAGSIYQIKAVGTSTPPPRCSPPLLRRRSRARSGRCECCQDPCICLCAQLICAKNYLTILATRVIL